MSGLKTGLSMQFSGCFQELEAEQVCCPNLNALEMYYFKQLLTVSNGIQHEHLYSATVLDISREILVSLALLFSQLC